MTDDATLLLHAILDNPGEDAPRASLADYLMEYGETEFHRYYGRFIACQLAGGYFQENLWSDTLVGPAALHMKSYAFQLWRRWGDVLTPVAYHSTIRGGGTSDVHPGRGNRALLHFNRGFVRAVDMTMDEFLRLGLALFRRHPIEEVRVRNFGFFRSTSRGFWRIYVNNLPSVQLGDDGVFYLPVGFKTLLKSGRLRDPYGDRDYLSELDALDDLSQASVAFARKMERDTRGGAKYLDFPTALTPRTELRTLSGNGGQAH